MTPLRSCDDINGFCDGNIFNTVTEESGLFMGKTPPCDDSDGNTGIIPTSYESDATQPQLGEYENNTDNTVTPSHPAQNTCKTQHSNCDDIEYITVTDTSKTVTTPLEVPEFIRRRFESQREQADALGLVARWSRQFGYIAIHDPPTGDRRMARRYHKRGPGLGEERSVPSRASSQGARDYAATEQSRTRAGLGGGTAASSSAVEACGSYEARHRVRGLLRRVGLRGT